MSIMFFGYRNYISLKSDIELGPLEDGIPDFLPLLEWKTGNVTDMSGMFADYKPSSFGDDIDNEYKHDFALYEWNTSNLKDSSFMFANTEMNANIAHWDVKKIANMSFMFSATKFSGGMFDTTFWNISNYTDLSSMFT